MFESIYPKNYHLSNILPVALFVWLIVRR